jgi:formylglycine-generating enzyme
VGNTGRASQPDGRTEATALEEQASDMVWIPGGEFWMGSNDHYPEEAPLHRVQVEGFWIDRAPVTNAAFARFAESTGYVTLAQRAPDRAAYPGADPLLLVPGSSVFISPPRPVSLANPYNWWSWVPGADWRHPQGPGSSIEDKPDHPVVHVAWEDVTAFAEWSGGQLPTEAEWELAARGGLDRAPYAWGDELNPHGQWMANTWQGEFPMKNTAEDGYVGTSPVGMFAPNGYGLLDIIGNVWEWTADWYAEHSHSSSPCCSVPDPRGGSKDRSIDPRDAARVPRRVMKGGSHLCAANYCRRYRPAARMPQAVDTSTSHLGFRLVVRADGADLRS